MRPNRSEVETVGRAVQGHEAYQRRLYERHCAQAYRLACLLLRDTRDAEEVVQDAFIYAFRNLDRYDPERGSFWTWLRVILVSRSRNKRRRKRLPRVSLDLLKGMGLMPADPKPRNNPAHVLAESERRRMVWEALQRVSPGARDALILRYYEGLSHAEIAKALGCSNEAARSRVAHGKVQMRRLLTSSAEEWDLDIELVCLAEAR